MGDKILEIDEHVTKKYDFKKRLGKGVSYSAIFSINKCCFPGFPTAFFCRMGGGVNGSNVIRP